MERPDAGPTPEERAEPKQKQKQKQKLYATPDHPMKPIQKVAEQSYVRDAERAVHTSLRPFGAASVPQEEIVMVSPEEVAEAARTMEATLVMAEGLPLTAEMTVGLTHRQLAHFVAYMRTLDDICRRQNDEIEALQRDKEEHDRLKKLLHSELSNPRGNGPDTLLARLGKLVGREVKKSRGRW